MQPIIEEKEYKGNPVIALKRNEDDQYPFSFGLAKARLIIAAIDDIRAFVAKYERKNDG